MKGKLLHIFTTVSMLCFSLGASAQNYLTQSFDATTYPPTGWTSTTPGFYNWQRVTSTYATSYPYDPPYFLPHTGAGMAWFNSYNASTGSYAVITTPALNFSTYSGGTDAVSFWFYRDFSYAAYDSIIVYANTSASLTGATNLGAVCRYYNYVPAVTIANLGWNQYTFQVPASFRSSSTVYLMFKAYSAYGDDMGLDDISIDHYSGAAGACSGSISAAINRVGTVCYGQNFTMFERNSVYATGVKYQWQSATSPSGPWNNIAGATSNSYLTQVLTGTGYFRVLDTCVASGNYATSNVDTVNGSVCYCSTPQTYYSGAQTAGPQYNPYSVYGYYCSYYGYTYNGCYSYKINLFAVWGSSGSYIRETTLTCPTNCTADGGNGAFDRTTTPHDTVSIVQGQTYNDTIGTSYGYYVSAGIWVDWNDNGMYEQSENVWWGGDGCCTALTTSWPGTINVPLLAPLGYHKMRVRYCYSSSSSSNPTSVNDVDPCSWITPSGRYYYYGAAQDYMVNVQAATACSGTPTMSITSSITACRGQSSTIVGTVTLTGSQGFQWQSGSSATGPWTNIPGATNTYYTFTPFSTGVTYYQCNDTCRASGSSTTSNVCTVTTNICYCTPIFYYSASGPGSSTCNSIPTTYSACRYPSSATPAAISRVAIYGYSGSNLLDGALACPTGCNNGYFDRTALSVNLQQGGSYADTVYNLYGRYDHTGIWIDFNDDGVFSNATEEVFLGGNYSTFQQAIGGTINIPLNANPGTHRMRVRSAYTGNTAPTGPNDVDPCAYQSTGSTIYTFYGGSTRDYVANIIQAPPCSGTPSISVTPSGPLTLCTGATQTLTATYAIVSGQSFQWLQSTTGGATWTAIPGATNVSYTFTMGGSGIWYMLADSCASSGIIGYSSTVIVNLNTLCYCTPNDYYPGNGCFDGGLSSISITGYSGSTLNDNPPCNPDYQDRTSVVAPLNVLQGGTYSGTLNLTYDYYSEYAIWVDWNNDGTFTNSSPEFITSTYVYGTPPGFSIPVPATATPGIHRMRVRGFYNGYYAYTTPTDPCATTASGYYMYYGSICDYNLNVQSTVPSPSISPSSVQNLCAGGTISFTATTSVAGTKTWTWSGPNGYTSTTTNSATSNSVTVTTSSSYVNTGVYSVYITTGGVPSGTATDTVYVWAYPSFVAGYPSSTSPVCTPNPLQLYCRLNPPNSTVSWSGPSSFSSTLLNPVVANPTTIAAAASLSGTYTISASNQGCITTGSTSVQVRPTPSITSISGTNPTTCTCNCGSITLSGLNPSTTYTLNYIKNGTAIGPLSIASNTSGNVIISGLSAGIFNNITLTLNGCPSNTMSITINNPSTPPTPTVSSNAPVCLSTPLNFTGTVSASGLTWTWNGPGGYVYNNTGTTSNPVKTASAVFSDSGNYYVWVTDVLGCTSPIQAINVVVKPRPNTPTVASNNAAPPAGICQGSTLVMTMGTATPPGTAASMNYSWTDPTGGTINPSTGTVYSNTNTVSVGNVANAFAGNWVVYSVLNGCPSYVADTFYTYIKWTPGTPTVSSNSPVCIGQGYNNNYLIFSVNDTSAGVSYTWSGPAAIIPNPNTKNRDTVTNPSATAAGTYSVFASLNGCSSPSVTTSVSLNATPVKPIASPSFATYCQFQPTTTLTATGTNLLWHMANTGGPGSVTAPTPADTLPGLYVYYVTQSTIYGASSCESLPANDTVLVKAKPGLPYGTTNFVYCQGDNAALLSVIGANVLWYTSSSGGVGSAAAPTPSTAVPGTFYYYASQTVNGCESSRLQITVLVKSKPPKPGVQNKNYCQNDFALPLSASGSNLMWYRTSSGGVGSAISPTPSTLYADTVYYYVTQNVNGCESDRAQIMVIVDYTPNALIVANQPYVCQYDSMFFTYFGNALPTASFNWAMPVGATLLHGNNEGPIWVKFDSAGKKIVTLQVTNKNCKSPVTNYILDVRQAPYAPTNVKADICQGQIMDISLGYANEHIDNFNWDFDGADIVYGSDGGGPFGVRWNTSGQHIVKLVAWTNSCPSIPVYDTVNVHPLADAHIGDVSTSNICSGDSVVFTAERYNPAYLYQWQPAIYFGTQNNMGQVYGYIENSGYITLNVTTEFGCTSTDSTLISAAPCCEVYFPNAFTPNGDGKNDVFRPISKGNQVFKTFRVTNRWGQVVFETVNPRIGWDGKFNGVLQDLGTYYYFIRYVCANGKVYEEKGEVLLIK